MHSQSGALFRMDFSNSITNTPVFAPAGTLGSGLVNSFHPFVYNDKVHFLICVRSQSRVDRRKIHTLPSPAVTGWYSNTHSHTCTAPGRYNLTLHMDQGFFSGASAFCKPIVVVAGIAAPTLSLRDGESGCSSRSPKKRDETAASTSEPCDMGVYQYFIDGTGRNGHAKLYKGNLTLVR